MSLCKVEIYEASKRDLQLVKRLIREIFDRWHSYYAERGLASHNVLVARVDGLIVGFVQFKVVDLGVKIGHIYYMGVRRAYRGRGIGRTLVVRAEGCMKDHVACFIASTQENNVPVLRLFRSLGYSVISWRRAYEILKGLGAELEDEYDLMWKIYDYDDVALLKVNKRVRTL
ncbi:MAG: GNAT family N-acetyltransferase [Crenarchaeota archaeon]|nr:GNAT family N-acetyltransferase [Thermoproteota archaeon]